jgi:hypothetical protein
MASGLTVTPKRDTFGRVFSRIDPVELQSRFLAWMDKLLGRLTGQQIALDGKTSRGSHTEGDRNTAIHLVNA